MLAVTRFQIINLTKQLASQSMASSIQTITAIKLFVQLLKSVININKNVLQMEEQGYSSWYLTLTSLWELMQVRSHQQLQEIRLHPRTIGQCQ